MFNRKTKIARFLLVLVLLFVLVYLLKHLIIWAANSEERQLSRLIEYANEPEASGSGDSGEEADGSYGEDTVVETDDENDDKKFVFQLNTRRIDKLFRILKFKEKSLGPVLEHLGVVSFDSLIDPAAASGSEDRRKITSQFSDDFGAEIENFLVANKADQSLQVSEKFVRHLENKSSFYSFKHPRVRIAHRGFYENETKPVIVTAADSNYFPQLQATVFYIHEHFPDFKLIIYDLGLKNSQLKKTAQKCKCEIRKFDKKHIYSKFAPHTRDIGTYSWKPLIIQEVLRDHGALMYADTSVRFNKNQIASVFEASKDVGVLTRLVHLQLPCFTHSNMFRWFSEKAKNFKQFSTSETNVVVLSHGFLTSLIMKAWVTCALDKACIAPSGSRSYGGLKNLVYGCVMCGCHRYDQDALSIISSFFFGHPLSFPYLPANSLSIDEAFFYTIDTESEMKYF